MKSLARKVAAALALSLLTAIPAAPAARARAEEQRRPAAAAAPTSSDRAMSAWVDDYFKRTIALTHTPGAVVVIVRDGKPIFMKGYGVTDAGGRTVDPATTLFRLGSITKVMTAIVASELIEEGKVDPNADVNRYLRPIQVPRKFGQPVRVENLLYHMGGFAADLRGVDAPTQDAAQVSPKEMQRLLVPRARPPGRYPAYDNNGWGVLGLAMAGAAGESYPKLVQQRVFGPTGMTHAVIGVPADRAADTASDHLVSPDGQVRRIDWSVLKPMEEPAGNASATGADMARFMVMLLQKGSIDGRQVLSPGVFHAMTDFDARRFDPQLPGLGRAIYEERIAGRPAIRHDGGMRGSAASMVLYPDQHLGVFFAINARPYNPFDAETLGGLIHGVDMFLTAKPGAVGLSEFLKFLDFHKAFAARYLPAYPDAVRQTGPLLTRAEIGQLVGKYRATSSDYASFAGALQVGLIEGRQVGQAPDGGLLVGGVPYRQISRGLFEDPATGERVAFHKTPYGQFMGPAALWIQKRTAAWDNPLLTIVPLFLCPLLLLTGVFYGLRRTSPARGLGPAGAGLVVLFTACVVLEGQYANAALVGGWTWVSFLWRLLMLASVLGLAGWVVLAVRRLVAGPTGGIARRAHFALLSLSAAALVWVAIYWRLIDVFRS